MHRGQFGHFENAVIFRILGVFWSGFLHTRTLIWFTIVFRTFLAYLIFDPNWPFCMGYSPCIVANFGHFQNGVIFRMLGDFWSSFLDTRTLIWFTIVFRTFLAYLIFDPKWVICMGYSPCIVANFGRFQNSLIFGILGVFWSGFWKQQL